MANLKRNSIELVKDPSAEELEFEKFWTVPFPSLSMVYEAADLEEEYEIKLQEAKERGEYISSKDFKTHLQRMADFLANRVYGKQFTKEDLAERFYGPNAFESLREQVLFVASGTQTSETKKFLAAKKN